MLSKTLSVSLNFIFLKTNVLGASFRLICSFIPINSLFNPSPSLKTLIFPKGCLWHSSQKLKHTLSISAILAFSLITFSADAQITPRLNFYRYNWQLANPAAVDKTFIFDQNIYLLGNVTIRKQWWDIEGAPQTGILSFEHRSDSYYRIGVNVLFDHTHAFKTGTAIFNYTYFKPVGNDGVIYLGLSPGFTWFWVDQELLTFENTQDETVVTENQTFFDFGFGLMYVLDETFYFGIASPQLAVFNLSHLKEEGLIADKRLKSIPINVLLGGIIRFNEEFSWEPSVWLRYSTGINYQTIGENFPFSIDLDSRFNFFEQEKFWVSMGGSTTKTARFGLGFAPVIDSDILNWPGGKIDIGIVYEFPFSETVGYFGQSMELNIRVASF